MKILLLHEMSGVHTELRSGLRAIGVDVDMATYGDGWKKFKTDIFIGNTSGRFSVFERILRQITYANNFKSYDVIQFISPNPFSRPLDTILTKYIFSGSSRVIYVAAGSDAVYRKHVRSLPYHPPHDWFDNVKEYSRFSSLLDYVDKIIPVCHEYKYAMEKDGRECEKIIPFPVDISKHVFNQVGNNRKIRFFHPLNRDHYDQYDFKGTRIIKEVFNIMQSRYSDVAEFLMVGGLPHEEYSRLTDTVDVIVDQLYSMSYGMSATYGLVKGKVVISGLEEIVKSGTHYAHCPVINVRPSKEDLIDKIESLIINRAKIHGLSDDSRSFATEWHDHKKVASMFLRNYK